MKKWISKTKKNKEYEPPMLLLYSINELTQMITFITISDLDIKNFNFNIRDTFTLSFTDFYRYILEIAEKWNDLYDAAMVIYPMVYHSPLIKIRNEADVFDQWTGSENIILAHYASQLKQLILHERQRMNELKELPHIDSINKKLKKTLEEWDSITFENINIISTGSVVTPRERSSKYHTRKLAVLPDSGTFEYYYLDTELMSNLIFDFFCVLNKLNFGYCTCQYCGEKYIYLRDSRACSKQSCRDQLKKDVANETARDDRNKPFNLQINRFANATNNATNCLVKKIRSSCPEDLQSVYIARYEDELEKVKNKFFDRLEEYRHDERDPNDQEFDDFYHGLLDELTAIRDDMRHEIKQFRKKKKK